mmetsp:Transcript_42673/g.106809  ORF Transcript_42673/g.106809 Transcript_42673/m.106809 type:complete len:85 (+) Transcript_42673:659-913(+)
MPNFHITSPHRISPLCDLDSEFAFYVLYSSNVSCLNTRQECQLVHRIAAQLLGHRHPNRPYHIKHLTLASRDLDARIFWVRLCL